MSLPHDAKPIDAADLQALMRICDADSQAQWDALAEYGETCFPVFDHVMAIVHVTNDLHFYLFFRTLR